MCISCYPEIFPTSKTFNGLNAELPSCLEEAMALSQLMKAKFLTPFMLHRSYALFNLFLVSFAENASHW